MKNKMMTGIVAGLCVCAVGFMSAPVSAAFEDPIMNGDFENGKTVGWDITGDRCVDIATKKGDVQGTGAMHYWKDKDFHFVASQVVEDVPDGVYNITVMTQGGGGEKGITFFAEVNGQKKTTPITNTGWNKWQTWTLENVEVKGGKCTIGVDVDGNAGNWGSFDNFKMEPAK